MEHLIHDTLSTLLFSFSILSFILGIYILRKNYKNLLNIFFFLQAFSLSIFFLLALLLYHHERYYLIIIKLYLFIESLFLFSFFNFINLLTKTFNNLVSKILFPIGIIVAAFAIFFFKNPVTYIVWKKYSMLFNYNFNSPNMIILIIIDFFYILISILMLFIYRKRIKTRKEKKIIDSLLISSIASTITNILTAIVITIIINRSLFLDHFIILNVVIVEYALVFYYWFLNYDTQNIIKEILSKISNFVVILDTNLRIIDMSLNFKTMASNNLNCSSDISFEKFIIEEKLFLVNIKKALYEKIDAFNMNISYKTFDGRQIETNTTITKIYDRFGDFFSFLIVSKQNNHIAYFKSTYKLTDRQMEIIQFAINGKTNEEIANLLNLKKRTVESHLFNIYYKLNIYNKIELMKLFNGYFNKS